MKTVRIGLLGFGRVGAAVAHAAGAARAPLRARGFDLVVTCALVRDARRPRDVDAGAPPLTDAVEAFFDRAHDVVVEVLGGVEPARALVARALGRGVPVVTANKSLVAAHGAELGALAASRGTSLRYEASAVAGVPFIGTLARRPLAADVSRLSGIVNGTSHYVLSTMERERVTFADALGRARELGYAEPDPSADVEGRDAAEKLALIGALVGAPGLAAPAIETTGIGAIEPDDLAAARRLGGVVKPVVFAAFDAGGVAAFAGPAFLDARHPLAALEGCANGLRLEGRHVGDLFYSGPGAGPDVTAATILDDVVETVTADGWPSRGEAEAPATVCRAPETPWLARVAFPDAAPDESWLAELFGAHWVWVRRADGAPGGRVWYALTQPASRERIDAALADVAAALGATTRAIRALEC